MSTRFSLFARQRILVVGSGEIAHRICAGLRTAGRSVCRLDDLNRRGLRLHAVRTLVLADTRSDTNAILGTLSRLCRRRPARRPPLRLILIRSGTGAAASPVLPAGANLTLEVFDPEVQAVRCLLARRPFHAGFDPPYGQTPHVLIAGSAPPAAELLVQTLRLFHYGNAQPVVTLACEDPSARREAVHGAYPQAERFCRLRFTGIDAVDLADTPPVTAVFVCLMPPEDGLRVAQQLATEIRRIQGAVPGLHLEIGDTEPTGSSADWDGQLIPFSWQRDAFNPAVLLDAGGDELAQVVHEHYRDSIAAQGRDPNTEPAGQPWTSLEASYKDASRHQADHLGAKLATLDCRAVRDDLVDTFTFAPLEAERLAGIEHQRWAADRYLDGWTYAPERDNARKHHPQLIPYADLSEPMKDLDRFAVRLTPTLLARSGRGVVRMLVVAVVELEPDCRADRRLRRRLDEVLGRLAARYPDRGLVLASTLEGNASRLLVRRALDGFEAGLFLLCPQPLTVTLAAQADDRARHDLLELVARAERRITLSGAGEPEAWFARRAEIRLLLGAEAAAGAPAKQVLLDPRTGRLHWSFEY